MKSFFLYTLLFLFLPYFAKAQTERFEKKPEKILIDPLANKPLMIKPKPKDWNHHFFEKKDFNPFNKKDNSVDFTGKSRYLKPEFSFAKQATTFSNPDEDDLSALKGDQYFGEKTSEQPFLNVYCRDFQAIDGDAIDILLNDQIVVHHLLLNERFQGVYIPLKIGFNKIEFRALNQGTSGPNTAHFMVLNPKGETLFNEQWNLLTGYKARFIIVKNQ